MQSTTATNIKIQSTTNTNILMQTTDILHVNENTNEIKIMIQTFKANYLNTCTNATYI